MDRHARRELYQAGKFLQEDLESLLGFMARVSSSTADTVLVDVPQLDDMGTVVWTGPLGPYPSTVRFASPGSYGVLQPIRGNMYLFNAQGRNLGLQATTASRNASRQSSTSITDWTSAITRTVTIYPGRWEFGYLATSAYKRSAATGSVEFRIDVSGAVVDTVTATMVYDTNVAGTDLSFMPISVNWKAQFEVTEISTVTIAVEWRGITTAATTWFYGTTLTGSAIEVGPLPV